MASLWLRLPQRQMRAVGSTFGMSCEGILVLRDDRDHVHRRRHRLLRLREIRALRLRRFSLWLFLRHVFLLIYRLPCGKTLSSGDERALDCRSGETPLTATLARAFPLRAAEAIRGTLINARSI